MTLTESPLHERRHVEQHESTVSFLTDRILSHLQKSIRPDPDSDHVCPDPRDFSPPPLFSPVHRNAGAKFHGQRTNTA